MKTKNVKVRVKDIKAGVAIYTSHPIYGIESSVVVGKPFMISGIGLFYKVKVTSKYGDYRTEHSICDSGIKKGESYNYRRTFFKLKHAEEWAKKMLTDKGFIKQQQRHENSMKPFNHVFA
jgi:hypothetical protein